MLPKDMFYSFWSSKMTENTDISDKVDFKIPADYLGYTVNTQQILSSRGISMLGEVIEKSSTDLLLMGIDGREVGMIQDRLKEYGVKLGTKLPDDWKN